MELKEFSNPESKDYDINSSLNYSNNSSSSYNPYSEQLANLIGILEDVTEEELQDEYGITMNEYLNPTLDTIEKVKYHLNERSSKTRR